MLTIFTLGLQETESEEDILDEGDDDVEEEHDHEHEVPVDHELMVKAPEVSAAPREAERQLSKKERKKKELAELEALLADFGVAPKESSNGQNESRGNLDQLSAINNFLASNFQVKNYVSTTIHGRWGSSLNQLLKNTSLKLMIKLSLTNSKFLFLGHSCS